MKKIVTGLLLTTALTGGFVHAQDEQVPDWGIKFSGFVKTDYYIDSRQTVSAREGHFLLWPAAENLDPDGNDINAKASFNLLSIQTRLRGTITGPDVLGAKTSAAMEGAFFGHTNADINGFRLRHAYAKLNWEKTELLVGQYWHPMFVTACFPAVLSFNTGTPFYPFSRNPQVRLTYSSGPMNVSATAFSHVDFASAAGRAGLRNSGIPELHTQVWYDRSGSEAAAGFLIGGGAGYKKLVPEIQTSLGYKTSAGVGSLMAEAYTKLTLPKMTVKAEFNYGQNNYDVLMISSYAVTSMDPATGENTYTTTSSYAAWMEIMSNNKTWQPGFFAGYARNLGAAEDISAGYVAGSRGNIDHVYRLSPRLIYNTGKMRFGIELEYTAAAFGTINNEGLVDDPTEVGNLRMLLGAFYFF